VYPVHLLVIRRERLELHAEAQVAADGHALLAGHRHNRRAIVLEYLVHTHADQLPASWAGGRARREQRRLRTDMRRLLALPRPLRVAWCHAQVDYDTLQASACGKHFAWHCTALQSCVWATTRRAGLQACQWPAEQRALYLSKQKMT